MHDPKFEQEVQQKLQELSFSPSEAVWTNVARAVNGEKKRRVPVFWLFLLPALLLTGAGVVYFSITPANKTDVAAEKTAVPAGKAGTTMASAEKNATSTAVPRDKTIVAAGKTADPAGKAMPLKEQPVAREEQIAAPGGKINMITSAGRGSTSSDKTVVTTEKTVVPGEKIIPPSGQAVTPAAYAEANATERASLPRLNVFDRHFSAPAASRLSSRSQTATAAKAVIQLKPRYTWEAGFAGGIGVSSLNKTLFQQPSTLASDVRQSTNASTAITGAPKAYTSKIRPDLSYWAGIVAQRPLSSRFTLSLGLNIHYYSMKVQIGEKVETPPSSAYYSQSLFTASVPQVQAAVYPYYSVGNKSTYTNRYYFLELPGSVLWQVNHSRNLPIFWEGGLSLSYLVSSNALYYNSKSAVFYKDGGMTNKTQLNLATALLVGLPVRGIRLQAGPQIQYGVTSLQSNEAGGGQHLFYGGLRLVLLPGKAKK